MPTKVLLVKIGESAQNPVAFQTEGYLYTELKVGNPIVVTAFPIGSNAFVEPASISTTEIQRIDGDIYHTKNSIYKVTEIK